MNEGRATRRVLMVMPSPALVRAAVAAGLEVWAADTRLPELEPDPSHPAGPPPRRLLPVDLMEPATLRATLEHTVRANGIDQVVCSESEVRAVLGPGPGARAGAVLREISQGLGRPWSVLPDTVTLRRLLQQGGYAGPHLADEPPAGPRFRVRTLTVDGMHLVVDITALKPAAPPSEAERAGIRATVRALLDLAGFEHGSAQTEAVLTTDGCHIVRIGV
ncbi:hypothetical protein GCM10010387_05780 [Streptomyces inusitatus]|uniref:Uncharacterized protein n=1 Tax=Streptomyces inusitatus TaxID=68221 RepID=A0A918PMQ9_9ACTN|nr:hypothetical protein [Streptomyces inusitatus]GGZ16130.1 hypothetical protein GCM10010387_05780 [Streptomyces inusitatus]